MVNLLFLFQIYVIDSADRKRFEETGQVRTDVVSVCVTVLNLVVCGVNKKTFTF